MNKTGLMMVLVGSLLAGGVQAAESVKLSEQIQSSLFSQLLGHWQISDQSLDANGQWQPGPGADWHFYPILNGQAIQDDWVSPPAGEAEPAGGRQYGTNIRIFNPGKQRWEMAWASVKGQQIDTFYATEQQGQVVMTGQFNGRSSRITFFDIGPEAFHWKLEFNDPEDSSWQEVYRIQGRKLVTAP